MNHLRKLSPWAMELLLTLVIVMGGVLACLAIGLI